MAHFEWRDDSTLLLFCRVRTNAKSNAFGDIHPTQSSAQNGHSTAQVERIDIRIQAPPREGRANALLIRFLADAFDVPKSSVSLIKGPGNRDKTVSIFKPGKLPAAAGISLIHEQHS